VTDISKELVEHDIYVSAWNDRDGESINSNSISFVKLRLFEGINFPPYFSDTLDKKIKIDLNDVGSFFVY
jgi:hypothetical protein